MKETIRANRQPRAEVVDIGAVSGPVHVPMVLPRLLWADVQDRAVKECTTVPRLVERALSEYVKKPGWIVRGANRGRGINVSVRKAGPPDPPEGDAA
jgi:hypothetical protein